MAKILIGVTSCRNYEPFWESLSRFMQKISGEHEIQCYIVKGQKIDEARETVVRQFLHTGSDYLLFLDDDHFGHTKEMLDALLKANTYMCGIKCYSKYFPYYCTLMNFSGRSNPEQKYMSIEAAMGYQECDLVGFGMTLIKKEVFQILEKPYFVAEGDTNKKEDNYFCDKLIEKKIKPVGCFDYVLPHCGIDDNNVVDRRKANVMPFLKHHLNKSRYELIKNKKEKP